MIRILRSGEDGTIEPFQHNPFQPVSQRPAVLFLILSILFKTGKSFLEFVTAWSTVTSVLVPVIAVAPVGVFGLPILLKIFAVSAEVDCRNEMLWQW